MGMARQIEAIYSNGVFHPLEPLTLHEGQRVLLTVHVRSESTEPMNERREELAWLANESGPYAAQWVALDGGRLLAHGCRLAASEHCGAGRWREPAPLFARTRRLTVFPDAPASPH